MKKSKIVLAFICIAALSSCSKDDAVSGEQPQQDADHIIGTWKLSKIGNKAEMDGEILFDDLNDGETPDFDLQYTFNSDNTVNLYVHFPATDTREEKNNQSVHEYERRGNHLLIKRGQPERHSYTIITLDDHNLHLENITEWDSTTGEHNKLTTLQKFVK